MSVSMIIMRILYPEDSLLPGLPHKVMETIHLSKPELIITEGDSAAQPPKFMGPEPDYTWCYYFQKAELARQIDDWQLIVDLGDEAFRQSYFPNDVSELLPFIEGFARVRDWDRAEELTGEVIEDDSLQPILCSMWLKIGQEMEISAEEQDTIASIRIDLGCQS